MLFALFSIWPKIYSVFGRKSRVEILEANLQQTSAFIVFTCRKHLSRLSSPDVRLLSLHLWTCHRSFSRKGSCTWLILFYLTKFSPRFASLWEEVGAVFKMLPSHFSPRSNRWSAELGLLLSHREWLLHFPLRNSWELGLPSIHAQFGYRRSNEAFSASLLFFEWNQNDSKKYQ